MTIKKELRVFAVAALGLGLFSANSFAQPVEDDTLFQITAEVEDFISVEGLTDVSLDIDSPDDNGYVYGYQNFTIVRRGATEEAPGKFSITASSSYGAADRPDYHLVKNQRDETLPVAIEFSNDSDNGRLRHEIPLINMATTNQQNEHQLMVGFHPEDLENPKPGTYSTDVTITVAAE